MQQRLYKLSEIHGQKIVFDSLTLKSCWFGVTNIVKNSDEVKWVYSDYGRALDGGDSWSSGNDFSKNVVNFGVFHHPNLLIAKINF